MICSRTLGKGSSLPLVSNHATRCVVRHAAHVRQNAFPARAGCTTSSLKKHSPRGPCPMMSRQQVVARHLLSQASPANLAESIGCESERVVADYVFGLSKFTSPDHAAHGTTEEMLSPETAQEVARTFRRDGVVTLPIKCPESWISEAKGTAEHCFASVRRAAAACGERLDVGMSHGWAEAVHRTEGRYDIHWGIDGATNLQRMRSLWEPVVQELLGGRSDLFTLNFNGLLMTLPGAAEQAWHADGEHLFFEQGGLNTLPTHCVNVFVPLVPLNEMHGGTDFCTTSQVLTDGTDKIVWQDNAWKSKIGFEGETHSIHADAGEVIMFDYRVLHRGHAHRGHANRPVLYWTYTRRWFSDNLNFPVRSLKDRLGGVDADARQQFPALARDDIFADGAAGTQVPQCVVDAVSRHLIHHNANVGGMYCTSQGALATVSAARQAAAALLDADPQGIVFGLNCTNIMMHLSRSLSRTFRHGDNIVVSSACHDANVAPWLLAARDAGVEVRTVPTDHDGRLMFHKDLVDERTKLIAVGLASNALGTIQDVKRVVTRAREVGAVSILDGTHFVPHRRASLKQLGADALICSSYKFFGPHMGLMAARKELLEKLEPYKVGWRQTGDVLPAGLPTPAEYEISKWEMGTLPLEQIAGLEACVRYLASLAPSTSTTLDLASQLDGAFVRIELHEEALSKRFIEGMQKLQSKQLRIPLKLVGSQLPNERTPTFALASPTDAHICQKLVARGIYCSHGNHYAPALIDKRYPDGVTRISFMHYNTIQEVDRVLTVLEEITS